jgi:hypothetical protein
MAGSRHQNQTNRMIVIRAVAGTAYEMIDHSYAGHDRAFALGLVTSRLRQMQLAHRRLFCDGLATPPYPARQAHRSSELVGPCRRRVVVPHSRRGNRTAWQRSSHARFKRPALESYAAPRRRNSSRMTRRSVFSSDAVLFSTYSRSAVFIIVW